MQLMAIGEFAEQTRLSAKALRLYHELKLVVPARVDRSSGYRLYSEDQVSAARLVGHPRRAGLPLATADQRTAAPETLVCDLSVPLTRVSG